jgi:hypothetical protein
MTSLRVAAASQAFREQSVPSVMNAAPTHASPRYATRRVRGGPREFDQNEKRKRAEGREERGLRLPDYLVRESEHRRHDDRARAALLTAMLSLTALECRRRNSMRSAGDAPRS